MNYSRYFARYCAVCPYRDILQFEISGSCRFCIPYDQCGCNMEDWEDDRITEHCEKWFEEAYKDLEKHWNYSDSYDGLPF